MEKVKNILKSKKNQKIIILISIFLSIFILNMLTPLIADDYTYSFGKNGERVTNLLDIAIRQIDHYFTWGGRTVAHTIAQFFLMFPKWVFNFFNSIIYVIFIYLIYLHTKDNKEEKPLIILLIYFAIWFIMPTFGQTVLWLTGACNYLWTMTIMLFFLYLIRKDISKPSIIKNIAILLLGIIAGWTNENTSFGLITAIIGFMILKKYNHEKISNYSKCALIGNSIGFIILIIAPGNYAREAVVLNDNRPLIVQIVQRTIDDTINLFSYCYPLLIGITVLLSIYIYRKKKINYKFLIFLIAALFSTYSMILSPIFPPRAQFGVIIFTIMAFISLLYEIYNDSKLIKYIICNLIIISLLNYIPNYLLTFNDINNLQNTWEYRIKTINNTQNKKTKKFKFDAYNTGNSHNPLYGLQDIINKENSWPNQDIAKYYGIKSIKSKS